MKCSKCGEKIEKNQKYCRKCGAPVTRKKKLDIRILMPVGVGGICLLAILAVILIVSPQKIKASKLQEKLDLGNKYLMAAEYDKAIVAFDEALKIDEKSPDAAVGMAKVYNKKDQPEKALEYLNQASENLEYISQEKQSNAKKIQWTEKKTDYTNVAYETSQRLEQHGYTEKAEEAKLLAEKIEISINIIVVEVNFTSESKNSVEDDSKEIPEPTREAERTLAVAVGQEEQEDDEKKYQKEDADVEAQDEQGDSADVVFQDVLDNSRKNKNMDQGQELSAQAILENYITDVLLVQNCWESFSGSQISLDMMEELSGILGIQEEDINGDGIPELFVIGINGVRMYVDIYKINDGNVVQAGSAAAQYNCLGKPLTELAYGGTLDCFIKKNEDSFLLGIASSYYNANEGNGLSSARVNVDIFNVEAEGTVTSAVSISLLNGRTMFMNGDIANEGQENADIFIGQMAQVGLGGSWICDYINVLLSMDVDNTLLDLSVVPDPLYSGLATKEPGVSDLVLITSGSADPGMIFLNVYSNTTCRKEEAQDDTGTAAEAAPISEIIYDMEVTPEITGTTESGSSSEEAADGGIPLPMEGMVQETIPIPEEDNMNGAAAVPAEEIADGAVVAPEGTTVPEEIASIPESSPQEILNDYIIDVLFTQNSWETFNGTIIGSDAMESLSGILGLQEEDIDADGIAELLAIYMRGSRIGVDIYRVEDGTIVQKGSAVARYSGFGTPLADSPYGSTIDCFIKKEDGALILGIASCYYNVDEGNGMPSARVNVDLFNVDSGANVSPAASASILNGHLIYTNGDTVNGIEGGADSFIAQVAQTGLDGSWISDHANTLLSMNVEDTPQDLSSVSNPLSGGLAGKEAGVSDLVIITASSEESGGISLNVQNNTTHMK